MAKPVFKKASDLFPVDSLRFLLHRHLHGEVEGRGRDNVHASEVTKEGGLCPRLYALWDAKAYAQPMERLTTAEQVTFQIGRDVQDQVVNAFADMGRAVGNWKCLACGTLHEKGLRPTVCASCDSTSFKPVEIRHVSPVSGISCGIDMHLTRPGKPLRAVEIKTMNPADFKDLSGPLAEHRQRSRHYMRIMAESTDPFSKLVDTSEIVVLYITKGGYGLADDTIKARYGVNEKFSPFKEYVVKRDDSATIAETRPALVVKAHRAGEIGMPRGVCGHAMVNRAQSCEGRKACFSGDYPAQHDWKPA